MTCEEPRPCPFQRNEGVVPVAIAVVAIMGTQFIAGGMASTYGYNGFSGFNIFAALFMLIPLITLIACLSKLNAK